MHCFFQRELAVVENALGPGRKSPLAGGAAVPLPNVAVLAHADMADLVRRETPHSPVAELPRRRGEMIEICTAERINRVLITAPRENPILLDASDVELTEDAIRDGAIGIGYASPKNVLAGRLIQDVAAENRDHILLDLSLPPGHALQ